MTEDPLTAILVFLAVTGLVLALTSLSTPKAGRVRVRILKGAGAGPLAPAGVHQRDQTRASDAAMKMKSSLSG